MSTLCYPKETVPFTYAGSTLSRWVEGAAIGLHLSTGNTKTQVALNLLKERSHTWTKAHATKPGWGRVSPLCAQLVIPKQRFGVLREDGAWCRQSCRDRVGASSMPPRILRAGTGRQDSSLLFPCGISIFWCALYKIMGSLTVQFIPFVLWKFWNHTGLSCWFHLGRKNPCSFPFVHFPSLWNDFLSSVLLRWGPSYLITSTGFPR